MVDRVVTLTPEAEEIFDTMTKDQRRMSFSMNPKNVLSKNQIKKDLICALCQAILVDAMKCKECKNRFHKTCLNKFCRETGQCPMQCKKPKFISCQREVEKQIKNLKFACNNSDLGCDKVLSYEDAQIHDT